LEGELPNKKLRLVQACDHEGDGLGIGGTGVAVFPDRCVKEWVMIEVSAVKTVANFWLLLTFSMEQRHFDMRYCIIPCFAAWKILLLLGTGRLQHRRPGEIDITNTPQSVQ
jgi:hypothetical protein